MKASGSESEIAAEKITARIEALGDWRGEMLAVVRRMILEADPEMVEEWKWEKPKSPGIPVWSKEGIVCTGETYKQVVKLTFARGASVDDPAGLFNASLEGNMRRAIDLHEGVKLDAAAFKKLVRAAVAVNVARKRKKQGIGDRDKANANAKENAEGAKVRNGICGRV